MGPSADQVTAGKQLELSERAKRRLRVAARFLRQRGIDFPKQGDFYGQILAALEQQPDRGRLRELVDWLEAYEAAEASDPSSSRHPTK